MDQSEQAALEREREAFWGLLAAQETKLYNFLLKASNYSAESADLYQEVVLRAWKYFPSFDRGRSFPAWIFAIAHNEIRSHFNRCRRERAVIPMAELAQEPAAIAVDPDVALVLEAARRLPDRQRVVFFLFYYNRFSVAEVAAACGLSQGNVKFILNRGREAVRLALEAGHEK
ncbi:MAG: RNA polymerase sigma factor [Acidobacteria bacterium]|nr:RNA polymerase sigma factor [Acidobacteriota bacterium]